MMMKFEEAIFGIRFGQTSDCKRHSEIGQFIDTKHSNCNLRCFGYGATELNYDTHR